MDEKNETGSAAPETSGKQPPLRRVGSFTLGVCLIAAGIFFLLTYFVPGFPTQPVLRIVPAAGLALLGCSLPPARAAGNTIYGRC